MASAPSSPERPKAGDEDLPRRSSDQFTHDTNRRTSTVQGSAMEDDLKSEGILSNTSDQGSSRRYKAQSRSAMAAMMSGLESRLLPKAFTRGRDSSRGPSRRGSSLDSRSPSASSSRFPRSISPASRLHSKSKSTNVSTDRVNQLKMESAHNKSDEALVKHSGGLPGYVKPAEQEETGERLAKDVFDRDQNVIDSTDEEADESSSEEEDIPGVMVVHARGRKKKPADISTITPSDFSKSKDTKAADEGTFTAHLY